MAASTSRRDDDGNPSATGTALAHDFGQPCSCDECSPVGQRRRDVATAQRLRAEGLSLFAIGQQVGRSKEWLREYAGLAR